MVNQLPALAASHAGRIAKTIRSRRRNDAKKSSSCFHGTYFLLSSFIPCSASAPVTISARACAQSPSSLPLAVQRRNSHAWIISDAFHFSGNADRVHEKFRVARIEPHRRIRRKPYRRLYAFAAFLECFEVQILVPGKRLKSHRLAPRNSMQGILRRTQKSRTDIPVCRRGSRSSFMRTANTKSAPIQTERPLHHVEKVSYFVRTYVTSSVNESFWSLRNVQVVLK